MAEERIARDRGRGGRAPRPVAAAAEHRVGHRAAVGEPSVVVAVSAPAPRRGVRGRARDHRPHQGARRRSGRRRSRAARTLGRGTLAALTRLRALPSVERARGDARRVRTPGGARGAAAIERRARSCCGRRDGRRRPADARAPRWRGCAPSLRRVINATGVIVHTNLGRAPLPAAARAAVAAGGRGLLEPRVRPRSGRARLAPRPRRGAAVRADRRRGGDRRQQLRGRRAAGRGRAGRRGREVVVSRGQLVEIGGSFRIPDIVAPVGRAAGRGRHHEPHAAARLRAARSASGHRRRSCARTRRTSARSASSRRSRSRRSCGARRAGDRRRRLGRARRRASPVLARRAAGAALGARRRRARLLLRRQAARRPAGRADGRHAPRRSSAAARHPLARALRIDKLSLAALEATLRALPRPRARAARDPGAARCSTRPDEELAARARRSALAERRSARARSSAPSARSAAARCRCSSSRARSCARRRRRELAPTRWRARLRARRPAGRRPHRTTGALLLDPRTLDATTRSASPRRRAARSPRVSERAAHARHRRPHRPRQDRAGRARSPASTPTGCRRSASAASRSSSATRRSTLPSGRRLSVVDVPGPRALRAHDGRGRDGHRPVPAWSSPPTTA